MTVPAAPPAGTATPGSAAPDLATWATDVHTTAVDHETRIGTLETDRSDLRQTVTAGTILSGHVLVSPRSDGTVIAADPTSLAGIDLPVWLTTAAAASSAPVEVLTEGRFTEPTWTWTPGAPLFLGPAGALTATPPTSPGSAFLRKVATAVTPTLIQFNPSPPIKLA